MGGEQLFPWMRNIGCVHAVIPLEDDYMNNQLKAMGHGRLRRTADIPRARVLWAPRVSLVTSDRIGVGVSAGEDIGLTSRRVTFGVLEVWGCTCHIGYRWISEFEAPIQLLKRDCPDPKTCPVENRWHGAVASGFVARFHRQLIGLLAPYPSPNQIKHSLGGPCA